MGARSHKLSLLAWVGREMLCTCHLGFEGITMVERVAQVFVCIEVCIQVTTILKLSDCINRLGVVQIFANSQKILHIV